MKEHMDDNQQDMFVPQEPIAEERQKAFEKKRAGTQARLRQKNKKHDAHGQGEMFTQIAQGAETLKKQKPKDRAGMKIFLDTKHALQKAQREAQERERRELVARMLENIKKKS